jgi:hypothetical protein
MLFLCSHLSRWPVVARSYFQASRSMAISKAADVQPEEARYKWRHQNARAALEEISLPHQDFGSCDESRWFLLMMLQNPLPFLFRATHIWRHFPAFSQPFYYFNPSPVPYKPDFQYQHSFL